MIFAYARVSSSEQNTARQLQAFEDYAQREDLRIDRLYEEHASGKDFSREVYQAMKLSLRSGDTLIIKELDRLGRNMAQIKEEWDAIQKMGVEIIVIDTPILNTANKTDLEKSLIYNIVFELMAYLTEKERQKIKTRQAEGIEIAKKSGRYKGRKPIRCENFNEMYTKWKNKEISAVAAMKLTNLTKSTFYRKVRQMQQ
jgi:DNA invertase Pin-like site-specific DNA recombinase